MSTDVRCCTASRRDTHMVPRPRRCLSGHAVKNRSGMDLTEAEDFKRRWQQYTEELHKKYLNDLDNLIV